jgi:hypothetical protein
MIPKDGPPDPKASVTPEAAAANDDAIEGGGKPSGWDPFEVWRTRVRDARPRVRDSADESPES